MIAGLVLCVALAAVHRWLSAREEHRLAARLRRSEAYFRSVVRSGGDAVVILDDELRITWASPALDRALGEAAADLVGRPLLDVRPPRGRPGSRRRPAGRGAGARRGRPRAAACSPAAARRRRGSGATWRPASPTCARDPDVGAVVLHCRDMTERHAREQALQSVAYTDPMTGLPNRAGVLSALQAAVTEPEGAPVTLLMVELDGLAAAREHAGRRDRRHRHDRGGRRLRATVRGEDAVARLGGGAFAVLAHGGRRRRRPAGRPLPLGRRAADHDVGRARRADRRHRRRADRARGGRRGAAGAGPTSPSAPRTTRARAPPRRYDTALGDAAARRDRLRARPAGRRAPGASCTCCSSRSSRWRSSGSPGSRPSSGGGTRVLGDIAPTEFLPVAERAGLIGELVRWGLVEATTADRQACPWAARRCASA